MIEVIATMADQPGHIIKRSALDASVYRKVVVLPEDVDVDKANVCDPRQLVHELRGAILGVILKRAWEE